MPTQIPLNNTPSDRTEEVADIVDRMPSRFGLSVTGIASLLFILLLFFGWMIKYPDILRGQITITTRQPPVKLTANATGTIQLFKKNTGERVTKNEYLAVIKNAATTGDVQLIDSLLGRLDIHLINYAQHRHYFPEAVALGELSNRYFAFLNALYQNLDYSRQRPDLLQKQMLRNLSASQQKSLQQSIDEFNRLKQKYLLSRSVYLKDSTLFKEGLISETAYEQSKMILLANEQEFKIRNKDIISSQYQVDDASKKIQLVSIQQVDKERELGISVVNTYYDLKENIKQWEYKYVFKSPINGKFEFLSFLKDDDYIQTGQELFSVLPEKDELLGQVYLPSHGAGKIQIGQKVLIKIDDYPYTQYGSISGEVQNISEITNKQMLKDNQLSVYLVSVKLPEGVKTNYGSLLPIRFETRGMAEIITDNRRLIERVFGNLKHRIAK